MQDSIGGILDFRIWKSRFSRLSFDDEIDRIEVRFSLSSSGDFDKGASFKLFDVAVYAGDAHSNIFGEPVLAGKTEIVVPCVAEKQRIYCLGSDRDVGMAQNEIWNLGEAVQRHGVGAVYSHIAFFVFEDVADVASLRVFH